MIIKTIEPVHLTLWDFRGSKVVVKENVRKKLFLVKEVSDEEKIIASHEFSTSHKSFLDFLHLFWVRTAINRDKLSANLILLEFLLQCCTGSTVGSPLGT